MPACACNLDSFQSNLRKASRVRLEAVKQKQGLPPTDRANQPTSESNQDEHKDLIIPQETRSMLLDLHRMGCVPMSTEQGEDVTL